MVLTLFILKLALAVPAPRLEYLELVMLAAQARTKTGVLFFFLPMVNDG